MAYVSTPAVTPIGGFKGMEASQIAEHFYGDIHNWPLLPMAGNRSQSQIMAVCGHIAATGDCLWHAEHVIMHPDKPCNCAGCNRRPGINC